MRGVRVWSIAGPPYRPQPALERAREQAAEFVAAIARRLEAHAAERGRRGLVVFAIDTELLGHWWSEGCVWLQEALRLAAPAGVRLVTLSEALAAHPGEDRELHRASWGDGKDLRTWDSAPVADLAWAARRLELRVVRALAAGLCGRPAERAVRELLALQASDWAFLDSRRQAGDYPFRRVASHSQALLEAVDAADADPRLRNLAPDLETAPLLAP
jgi:1,4-alpha-glucan branching enzyme